ncbi:MAG: oligopeptide transporter, OPT family [Planctomycetes bacterium]|nr:oligopeptide transporter, OPT family [Planctomycetota bacterium]
MADEKHTTPLVPAESRMPEFTLKAVLLGVVMAAIMGAANAYLGLTAGMTIAATYTTAVVGMAVIKAMKGTLLEENAARTVGSIGGNIATGATFTLPAFYIASVWDPFFSFEHAIISTIILIVAGVLGIMFVTILRRVLVEDKDLPFPESIAAAEIHKSGQAGASGSRFLFLGMGAGAFFKALVEFQVVAGGWQKLVSLTKGSLLLRAPGMNPAYFGVGYIIGPKLGAINFSGGVLAWGLLAPLIAYFIHRDDLSAVTDWQAELTAVWKGSVRYVAIGGMLVGAFYTLYRMRGSLFTGLRRSFSYVRKSAQGEGELPRTERDINIRWSLLAIGVITGVMLFVFNYFTSRLMPAGVAAIVMLFLGFVFAAVSGHLVGMIGVSNNPTSGLTVSVLIVVAFLMVALGMHGEAGLAAVLGVAAFACTSVSVAGEMMQDLKAGHILGCTPWRMQVGDIFGIISSAVVMFFVLALLHLGDVKGAVADELERLEEQQVASVTYQGKHLELAGTQYTLAEIRALEPEQQNDVLGTQAGFGGDRLAAPQASLMAVVGRGIVEAKTELILIVAGVFMGLALILMQVKSPMLISVGMYLPIETSFAIFVGGLMKGLLERALDKRQATAATKERVSNVGVLVASGMIAGEALLGLLFAGMAFGDLRTPQLFAAPSYLLSVGCILVLGALLDRGDEARVEVERLAQRRENQGVVDLLVLVNQPVPEPRGRREQPGQVLVEDAELGEPEEARVEIVRSRAAALDQDVGVHVGRGLDHFLEQLLGRLLAVDVLGVLRGRKLRDRFEQPQVLPDAVEPQPCQLAVHDVPGRLAPHAARVAPERLLAQAAQLPRVLETAQRQRDERREGPPAILVQRHAVSRHGHGQQRGGAPQVDDIHAVRAEEAHHLGQERLGPALRDDAEVHVAPGRGLAPSHGSEENDQAHLWPR